MLAAEVTTVQLALRLGGATYIFEGDCQKPNSQKLQEFAVPLLPLAFYHQHSQYFTAFAGFAKQRNTEPKTFVLTQNFQSEVMPAVEDLKYENLTALVIAYCGLTGSIPQCVAEKFHRIAVVGYIVESLEWNHSKFQIG
ncbi:hypothetical protein IFM89_001235 [Coptis chinensis]|uniref:Uncharacterized protein n=1 Tax=Coptis chinensis TaxID=261450 RepID=A0A835LDX3_9MAGN|nr:hypothetical protein IFM89_001235 [Coptis chinensis]